MSSSSGTVTSVGSKLISQAARTRGNSHAIANNNATTTATNMKTRIREKLGTIPTLAEFVHRRTVIHQYRHFLKAVTNLTGQDKVMARSEIQGGFRRVQYETDSLAIQMALKEGQRRLAQVQALVGHTTTHTTAATAASTTNAAFQDADSWLNTPDEDDPRGRVGTMWPWQQQQQQQQKPQPQEPTESTK